MKSTRNALLVLLVGAVLSAPATAAPEDDSMSATMMRNPAIRDMMGRIDADPESNCLHNELGILLASKAFFSEAQDAFREAAVRDAENPAVHFNIGTLYLKTGDAQKAIPPLRRALRLDSNLAMAWYNLGASYDALGDYDGAVDNYTRSLELDPGLADASVNPGIVSNRYLLPVKTRIYRRKVGTLGTPLRSTCASAGDEAGGMAGDMEGISDDPDMPDTSESAGDDADDDPYGG